MGVNKGGGGEGTRLLVVEQSEAPVGVLEGRAGPLAGDGGAVEGGGVEVTRQRGDESERAREDEDDDDNDDAW